jgi:hypothetical protein
MLKIFDDIADGYRLKLDAHKYECLTTCLYSERKKAAMDSNTFSFEIGGNVIEEVGKWTHLSHMINNKSTGWTSEYFVMSLLNIRFVN